MFISQFFIRTVVDIYISLHVASIDLGKDSLSDFTIFAKAMLREAYVLDYVVEIQLGLKISHFNIALLQQISNTYSYTIYVNNTYIKYTFHTGCQKSSYQ